MHIFDPDKVVNIDNYAHSKNFIQKKNIVWNLTFLVK